MLNHLYFISRVLHWTGLIQKHVPHNSSCSCSAIQFHIFLPILLLLLPNQCTTCYVFSASLPSQLLTSDFQGCIFHLNCLLPSSLLKLLLSSICKVFRPVEGYWFRYCSRETSAGISNVLFHDLSVACVGAFTLWGLTVLWTYLHVDQWCVSKVVLWEKEGRGEAWL